MVDESISLHKGGRFYHRRVELKEKAGPESQTLELLKEVIALLSIL
jgi:hypothetical protein